MYIVFVFVTIVVVMFVIVVALVIAIIIVVILKSVSSTEFSAFVVKILQSFGNLWKLILPFSRT